MKKVPILLIILLLLTGCRGDKTEESTKIDNTTQNTQEQESTKATDIIEEYKYTNQMMAAVNEDFLKNKFWEALIKTYGDFIAIGNSTLSTQQEYDIISVSTEFETAIITINIVFDSDKLIAGLNIASVEGKKTEYELENLTEIDIIFGGKDWELPGTILLPTNIKNPPVLILVHGSGPSDRDETIGPNKPFKDIAYGLAENGIGTLRYDKRTFVHTNKLINSESKITVFEETIDDALLAAEYLDSLDATSNSKIYILGHSLGGMLIPRIAENGDNISGYIIMAGPVTPMEDVIIEQIKYINEIDNTVSDDEKATLAAYVKMRDNIKSLNAKSTFESKDLFGVPKEYWIDLKNYNPAIKAKEISKPLLILQGERDYQVTLKEFNEWKKALDNKKNVSLILYENLNHLFIYGESKSTPEEYSVPGIVDDEVILDIANWINNQ